MFPWFPCIDDIDAHVSLRDFPAMVCRGTGAPPTDSIVVPQVKVLVNITGTQWKPVTPGEWAMGCFRHGELREFTDQQRKGGLICHNMSRFECCLKTVYIPMAVLVSKLMNQWIGFQTNPSGSGLADEVPSFGWSNPVWRARKSPVSEMVRHFNSRKWTATLIMLQTCWLHYILSPRI